MKNQGKMPVLAGIIVIILAVIIVFSAFFAYQYYAVKNTKNKQVENAQAPAQPVVNTPTSWQTYTSKDGKFSISYPSNWQLSTTVGKNPMNIVYLIGDEGSFQIDYGTGFGGACPQGYEKMPLGGLQFDSCNSVANDVKSWVLDSNRGASGIGMFVTANKPYASNEALILKILSTFKATK